MVQRDVEDGMKLLRELVSLFINGRRVTAKSYEELKTSVDAALTVDGGRTLQQLLAPRPKNSQLVSLKTTPFCAFPSGMWFADRVGGCVSDGERLSGRKRND